MFLIFKQGNKFNRTSAGQPAKELQNIKKVVKIHKIKIEAIFQGEIEVNAESREKAKQIAFSGMAQPRLNPHSFHSNIEVEGIKNYYFDIHAKSIKIK